MDHIYLYNGSDTFRIGGNLWIIDIIKYSKLDIEEYYVNETAISYVHIVSFVAAIELPDGENIISGAN